MLTGKLAGQNYNIQVRSSTAEQFKELALAPLHVHIYLAIVKKIPGDEATAIELGEVSSHHKEQIEILGAFAKKVEAGNNSEAVTIIPHFKLNTTYDNRWYVSAAQTQRTGSHSAGVSSNSTRRRRRARPRGANWPGTASSGRQPSSHCYLHCKLQYSLCPGGAFGSGSGHVSQERWQLSPACEIPQCPTSNLPFVVD